MGASPQEGLSSLARSMIGNDGHHLSVRLAGYRLGRVMKTLLSACRDKERNAFSSQLCLSQTYWLAVDRETGDADL